MNANSLAALVLVLVAAEDRPAPKAPVGKDTTYFTRPLTADGYIDYEIALNERLSKGIRPEKNANVLIWRALGPTPEGARMLPGYFKWLGAEEPSAEGKYFIDLRHYMQDHLKLEKPAEWDVTDDQRFRAGQRPWTAKDYPHIAGWLAVNERPLEIVAEATRRPDYYNPLVVRKNNVPGVVLGALMPSVQKCREICSALIDRAMLRISEKNFAAAWQDLLTCHRLGRLIARGATVVEAVVGIAIDQIVSNADLVYLEHSGLSAKQVAASLRDLQALPPMPGLQEKFDLAERVVYLDALQWVHRGRFAAALESISGGPPSKNPDPKELKALARIDWTPAFRTGNQWFDRIVQALGKKDPTERAKELRRIDGDLKELVKDTRASGDLSKVPALLTRPEKEAGKSIGNIFAGLMIPAFLKVQQASDRIEQTQRNLYVAFALAAYRSDHGRYPAKLDELAPKYLAKVPGDLFSGGALIYRPSEDGYLFYSVGVNGKDDGGRWTDDTPPGDDLRVRMPLPEPKPKK
jgi:hypothetical protein